MEIKVNTGTLKTNADREREVKRKLSSLDTQIQSCKSQVRWYLSSSASRDIDRALGNIHTRLTGSLGKLESMAGALDTAAALYSSAEKSIVDGKPTGERVTEAKSYQQSVSGDGSGGGGGSSWGDEGKSGIPFAAFMTDIIKDWALSSIGGSISGDILKASADIKGKTKFDFKEKEVYAEVKGEAEAHLAKGKAEGHIGALSGSVEGVVGSISAVGSVGASLFKDGKFTPGVNAKAEVSAAAVKGNVSGRYGDDTWNVHGKAKGSVLSAKAYAEGGLGMITQEDSSGNKTTAFGVRGKAGAEAYLAEGEVSAGLNLFGIKCDLSLGGKAGGMGASVEGSATTNAVKGKVGVGLGLGVSVGVNIDWSGFKLFNWK